MAFLGGADESIVSDVEMIRVAANFGFKVYYGDGTRLDVLRASGASTAEAVLICVDKGDVAVRIAEHMRSEFPLVQVLARSYDRGVSLKLVEVGVEYQLRETFESAVVLGAMALESLGEPAEDIAWTLMNTLEFAFKR